MRWEGWWEESSGRRREIMEGQQNAPPQNMPLGYKDYFELIIWRNSRHRRSSENRVEVTPIQWAFTLQRRSPFVSVLPSLCQKIWITRDLPMEKSSLTTVQQTLPLYTTKIVLVPSPELASPHSCCGQLKMVFQLQSDSGSFSFFPLVCPTYPKFCFSLVNLVL